MLRQCYVESLQGGSHTAHFIDLGFVHLLSFPGVAFDCLSVHLPLREESNLHCY